MLRAACRTLVALLIFAGLCLAEASAQEPSSPQPAPSSPSAGPESKPSAVSPPANASSTEISPATEARELLRSHKYDEAAAAYNKIIASGTDAAIGYAGLARVYLGQHNVADAYTSAAKAVELAPKSTDAQVALGEVLFRQGKIPEAEKELIGAAGADPRNTEALMAIARIDRAASYYAHAKRLVAAAHQIDPEDRRIRRAWFETLSREEKLGALRADLAGEKNADAADRAMWTKQLEDLENPDDQLRRSCHLATTVTSTVANLEPLMKTAQIIRGYGLTVNVNGVSAKLLIDTGASGILINRKMGEKAGIQKMRDTKLGGIGDAGPMGGYVGLANSIRVGNLEFQNCPVEVSDRNSIVDEDGLIGADVFAKFLIDIDFPNKKFRLSELPKNPQEASAPLSLESDRSDATSWHDPYIPPEMKSYTRVYRIGHSLLIPTWLNGTPARLFLVDTGGWDNTITPEAAREITKVRGDSDANVKGLSGKVKNIYTADNVTIAFAHFKQERHDLVAFDLSNISNSIGTEVSGVLGFRMLFVLDIKIDYRDGMIDFGYDPNRFH